MNVEWEMFSDLSYYDMWCVRPKDDKDFNSPRSFHFVLEDDARKFLSLVSKATVSILRT